MISHPRHRSVLSLLSFFLLFLLLFLPSSCFPRMQIKAIFLFLLSLFSFTCITLFLLSFSFTVIIGPMMIIKRGKNRPVTFQVSDNTLVRYRKREREREFRSKILDSLRVRSPFPSSALSFVSSLSPRFPLPKVKHTFLCNRQSPFSFFSR